MILTVNSNNQSCWHRQIYLKKKKKTNIICHITANRTRLLQTYYLSNQQAVSLSLSYLMWTWMHMQYHV